MADRWQEALASAGVDVESVDGDRVTVRAADRSAELAYHRIPYRMAVSHVPPAPEEPALLSLQNASNAAVIEAISRGWSVVSDTGMVSLDLAGYRVEHEVPDPTLRPGPVAWSLYTTARRLLAASVGSTTIMARRCGSSQPGASQNLLTLVEAGLIAKDAAGWEVTNWEGLLDWWLAQHPGPRGDTVRWSTQQPPFAAMVAAVTVAADEDARPVVSGPAVAAVLHDAAPPPMFVLYTRTRVSLTAAGFTPATDDDDDDDAGRVLVEACVPEDSGVWLPHDLTLPVPGTDRLPIADPTQVLADSLRLGDPEIAAALRRGMSAELRVRWRACVARA